jgi:predicted acyltransferase
MSLPSDRSAAPAGRIVSVDALRGFDMFWIIGADSVVYAWAKVSDAPAVQRLAEQMEHVPWEGFHFYDLIFPLFVFLVGASSVFSLDRIVQREGKPAAYRRVLVRSLVLYLLGICYYGALRRDEGPEMYRFVGVLQRIAICYLFGSLLLLNLKWRGLAVTLATLLLGYWALLVWVPVPGVEYPSFAEGKNLTHWIDQHFLPGYKWDGKWDPEGLLSHVPAVGTAILGIFAGMVLRSMRNKPARTLLCLTSAGVAGVVIGLAWSPYFPIIKKLWTSSYVMLAGGWSFLLLALFYLIIDVWKFDRWARPLVWIGMNAITIYLIVGLIDLPAMVRRVIHQPLLDQIYPYGPLLIASLSLLLAVAICYLLYRKQIFLRV